MKFTSMALAAAAGLLAQTVQAQGFFITGRVGQSDFRDVPGAKNDTSFALGIGYWFNNFFAFEGGYADLYDRSYWDGEVGFDGIYTGIKGRYLFDRGSGTGFFLGARGGAYFWDISARSTDEFGTMTARFDGTDWYAGAFAGYQFTPNWSVDINYDRFAASDSGETLKMDLISVGVEYKF